LVANTHRTAAIGRRSAVGIAALAAVAALAAGCGGSAQPAQSGLPAAGNVPAATAHAATPTVTLSGLPWRSGAYLSEDTPEAAAAFAAWRGRPLDVVDEWSTRATWQDIEDPAQLYQTWSGKPYTMVFGVAMLPEHVPGVSLSACASGAYNAHWREFGRVISSYGLGRSVIRLGWEFNGNWYVWQASQPSAWAECWRQIVTSARSTAPHLLWDWNVNRGISSGLADPRKAWPGDSYVNIVGVDSYDASPSASTPAGWQAQLNGSFGLNFWLQFAVAHGKQLSVPEWGNLGPSLGGQDDPQYVLHMLDFFKAHAAQLAYEANFQGATDSTDGSYGPDTNVPAAAAAYRAGF